MFLQLQDSPAGAVVGLPGRGAPQTPLLSGHLLSCGGANRMAGLSSQRGLSCQGRAGQLHAVRCHQPFLLLPEPALAGFVRGCAGLCGPGSEAAAPWPQVNTPTRIRRMQWWVWLVLRMSWSLVPGAPGTSLSPGSELGSGLPRTPSSTGDSVARFSPHPFLSLPYGQQRRRQRKPEGQKNPEGTAAPGP